MASKSFVRTLEAEIPGMVSDKLLTQAQASKILDRYKNAEPDHNVVNIIATFGAILIGLGILTFVATNWDQIPDFARVLILLTATFGSYFSGYKMLGGFPKVGASLLFLGAILFGVSIILIAQIYHLDLDNGMWLLLWVAGTLPVAYAFRSTPTLALSLLIFSYWFAVQFTRIAGGNDPFDIFDHWPITVVVFLAYGVLLIAVGILHELKEQLQQYAATFKILGIAFVLFNGYMITFKFVTNGYWRISEFQALPSGAFIAMWSFAIITLLVLGFALSQRREPMDLWIAAALAVFLIISLLVVSNPTLRPDSYYRYDAPLFTVYSLLMNVLFLGLLIGIAAVGMMRKQAFLVNAAVLTFAVDVITRYFEFFYDRLFGAVFFIITGTILILLAISLENLRRRLVNQIGK